ncbi:GtrA family protein, partial [Albidovulum sp.]
MIAADFLRFVLASGLGLVLDIALALALHDLAGLPLWLAATISFFAVALLNYLLFEFWIFARG